MKKFLSVVGLFIFGFGQTISLVGMSLISDLDIRREVAKGMADIGRAAGSFLGLDKAISDYEKSKLN